jgi:hypothetical protein
LTIVADENVDKEIVDRLVAATFDGHGKELSSGFAVLSKRSLRFRKSIQ